MTNRSVVAATAGSSPATKVFGLTTTPAGLPAGTETTFSSLRNLQRTSSVMKPVAHLDVNLSRLSEVRAAERVGTVQQESPVGQIHGLQCDQPAFSEAFAKRSIECCMALQVIWPIAIEKARTIPNIPGDITA